MAKKTKEKQLKITQVRSIIGQKGTHKKTIEALGLKRIRHEVIQKDTPQIRGMVFKVKHLVSVEEI
ncbi:MAG: 50S ribosomal protein L30 [Calditrichia bacterium]|nr:50S ribosomal protein L30 [Calditrichota bacterium]MCB0269093.1 50S ribosomal protein L30 [Calditrichota bacterium]MCB9067023.1 50S ribosomal protein L30 [Calditrichia bacterium]